jgi:hypothetical protein
MEMKLKKALLIDRFRLILTYYLLERAVVGKRVANFRKISSKRSGNGALGLDVRQADLKRSGT